MKIDNWLKINCKDLTGKRVVITGATGGLGREICFLLAKLNANIILACRNIESAENLKLDLKKEYKSINIDILQLDFCDVKSVKKCVSLLKKYKGIDILINNSGVYNIPLKKYTVNLEQHLKIFEELHTIIFGPLLLVPKTYTGTPKYH